MNIDKLHKAFSDINQEGQTTLMFDSILRTIQLHNYHDIVNIIVLGKDERQAKMLNSAFYDYMDAEVRVYLNLMKFVKINFIPMYSLDRFVLGRYKEYYLFEDHYIYEN